MTSLDSSRVRSQTVELEDKDGHQSGMYHLSQTENTELLEDESTTVQKTLTTIPQTPKEKEVKKENYPQI